MATADALGDEQIESMIREKLKSGVYRRKGNVLPKHTPKSGFSPESVQIEYHHITEAKEVVAKHGDFEIHLRYSYGAVDEDAYQQAWDRSYKEWSPFVRSHPHRPDKRFSRSVEYSIEIKPPTWGTWFRYVFARPIRMIN